MHISVIGTGYVGLVTGACFSEFGVNVTCVDKDESKIARLMRGEMPILEPGLDTLVANNVKAGRLMFTTDYTEALADAQYVFICVGTPSGVDGEADKMQRQEQDDCPADDLEGAGWGRTVEAKQLKLSGIQP